VSPAFRARVIAPALLNDTIIYAENVAGLNQINLSVIEDNTNTLRLYKTLGFKKYGCEPNALVVDSQSYCETLMFL